jgi:peptidoglycan/LPS O-acetylase OafA/YrhL
MSKVLLPRDTVLDSLRGIAALMVVMFHLTINSGTFDYGLHLGVTGVDLFFIISGFVIFMSLNKTKSSRDFIVNRFIRLYPTYWACVTFTFLLNAAYASRHRSLLISDLISYLGNMTMFQHYLGVSDLDGSYWTLIIEMVFYITMVAIYYFGFLKRIEIISFLLTLGAFFIFAFVKISSPFIYEQIRFFYPLLNHFPLFFAGIVYYLVKNDRPTLIRYVMLGICFAISCLSYSNLERSTHVSYSEHIGMLAVYFVTFLLYVNNKLSWLTNRMFLFLGTISYALYLIHMSIGLYFLRPFMDKVFGGFSWLGILLILAIVIGLASIVTYYIEKPAMKFLKARLQTQKEKQQVIETRTA